MAVRMTAADLIEATGKPKPRRGNPEAVIQKAIVKRLHAALVPPARVHASGHEQRGHGEQAKRRQGILKAMGARAGWPDLEIIAPGPVEMDGTRRPLVLFLEVKTPTGALQDNQREFRDAARAMGFGWALVRSVEDALAAVQAAGIEMKEDR